MPTLRSAVHLQNRSLGKVKPAMWIDLLSWLCAVSMLLTVIVYFRFALAFQGFDWLSPESGQLGTDTKLSVIIPARNEELDLADSLRAVLKQEGVHLAEVIVVNDHSTDRTGAIADQIAAADDRVIVIHNPPLAPGWFGKVNAMRLAAETASGELLLFTDADIMHSPACFATGLTELVREELDFLSLLPRFICESLWENVLVAGYVGGLATYNPRKVKDPHSPDAGAAGAFMLIRRQSFLSVGGFEAVRTAELDDVAFARCAKQQGLKVGIRLAPELGYVRLFKGNLDAFWGATKNVLAVFEHQTAGALAAVLVSFLIMWTPPAAVVIGAVAGHVMLVSAGVGIYTFQFAGLLLSRRLFGFRKLKLLFFPLIPIVIAACTARALYYLKIKGSVLWRGREINVS